MSAPVDRLVGDQAAERFAIQAAAVLAGPETAPLLVEMAAAITLLVRDRQARCELLEGRRAA